MKLNEKDDLSRNEQNDVKKKKKKKVKAEAEGKFVLFYNNLRKLIQDVNYADDKSINGNVEIVEGHKDINMLKRSLPDEDNKVIKRKKRSKSDSVTNDTNIVDSTVEVMDKEVKKPKRKRRIEDSELIKGNAHMYRIA